MMRRFAWLLCLLSLPSIASAAYFCRSYTITNDTYFDYANGVADYSAEAILPMRSRVSTSDIYHPFMYLAATALGVGETFDSATLVIYPNLSPIAAGTYNVYRILGAVPDGVSGATWYLRDSGHLWTVGGCMGAGTDHYATPVFTGLSWTGSADSVVICTGTAFSNFVRDYVLGSSQYIVMRFDTADSTAYAQWYASGTAHPAKLRIYGHSGPVASSRRRAMYAQP